MRHVGRSRGRAAQQGALHIALGRLGFNAAQFRVLPMQGHRTHAPRQGIGLGCELQLPVLRAARGLQPIVLFKRGQVTGQHGAKAGLQIGKFGHPLQREHTRRLAGTGNADLATGNGGGFGIRRAHLAHQGVGIGAAVLAFDPQRLLQQRRATQFEEVGLAWCRLRQLTQDPGRINAAGQGRAAEQQAGQQAGEPMLQGRWNARNHRS